MSAFRDSIITQQVLVPGQQLSERVPWERDDRPPPSYLPRSAPRAGNALDAEGALPADPASGLSIGACQVIRRLSPGGDEQLLGLRDTEGEGMVPVVLRRLEVPEAYAREVYTCADWAARLAHPNLARVFPCEESELGLFWVTGLVSGATLAELSDACFKAGKSVPVGLALAAVHEAALALAELHAPPAEAHGLLGDQSLVVGFDGAARVLDVGLIHALQHQLRWPAELDRLGPYRAPEQAGRWPPRSLDADPRSDVFALAALLHAFLSGGRSPAAVGFDQRAQHHRHGGYPPPSSLNVALSEKVDAVVMKALSPDPRHRYATAVDFALALRGAASELFWRKELRAQFAGQLFSERKRREEVLFAATSTSSQEDVMPRAAEERLPREPAWARAHPPPSAVKTSVKKRIRSALAEPSAPAVTRLERAFGEELQFADSAGEGYDEDGLPKSGLRPLLLALVALALAWVWQLRVPLEELPTAAPAELARLEQLFRVLVLGEQAPPPKARAASARPPVPEPAPAESSVSQPPAAAESSVTQPPAAGDPSMTAPSASAGSSEAQPPAPAQPTEPELPLFDVPPAVLTAAPRALPALASTAALTQSGEAGAATKTLQAAKVKKVRVSEREARARRSRH